MTRRDAGWLLVLGSAIASTIALAEMSMHHQMDASGMVMNANSDQLPRDCETIAAEHAFTVAAGRKYAADLPGAVYGMSQHELQVKPCSRITVTFVNEDEVRHQWMVHGLPGYLYANGMFHIEAAGGHRQTGTFIVPSDNATYLIHCDMAQHMEKGMKAQLVVGRGSGDLSSVPGISAAPRRDSYLPATTGLWAVAAALAGFTLAAIALRR